MSDDLYMKGEAVEVEVGGLKCDAPGCDWTDPSVRLEDYERWLNAPCPACGANVLTEADMRNTRQLMAAMAMVNELLRGHVPDDAPRGRIGVEMDGTGSIKFVPDGQA